MQILLLLRTPHVGDDHAGQDRGSDQLGVVVQELGHPADDVHAAGDAIEQHDPLGRREQPVGRRETADQIFGDDAAWRIAVARSARTGTPLAVLATRRNGGVRSFDRA